MSSKRRKIVTALTGLVLMDAAYGAVISLCNRYLRDHGMLTPLSKGALMALLVFGFYLIYRWFSRRIDSSRMSMTVGVMIMLGASNVM